MKISGNVSHSLTFHGYWSYSYQYSWRFARSTITDLLDVYSLGSVLTSFKSPSGPTTQLLGTTVLNVCK